MTEKRIIGRAIQKHDIEENWLKATNFTPMQGEIIVYDIDENYNYERFKIGDGESNVNDLPFAGGGTGDNSEILDLLINAPSKAIGLNETIPVGSMPSICDFEFKPTTPLCIYDLANTNVMPNKKFYGREIPFLTTKGNLIVTDKDQNIKINKYIDSLININRNGWNLSDKLTQNGIEKVWSKKFYITKDEFISSEVFDYGTAKNSRYVFEFDESDFIETGIPAKLDNIPVATSCFYTGNDSQSYLNGRVWGGQPFPLKFSYNKDTGKYTMTIRGMGADVILYQLTQYSKTYIYYQLETPYIENDFFAMGLEEGDKITFENDYSEIQEYLDTASFFRGTANGTNITDTDITPTILATVPQNTIDALNGFSNTARILNEKQKASEDTAQDYSWIGDSDGDTDYTSIIQNKIKELQSISNGGTIFLGNGTYKVSSFIELSNNIKLIGTGNTTIQQTNKNEHVIVLSGNNVVIKDIRLKLYAMTTEEKEDPSNYNSELTACVFVNSNNIPGRNNYNSKYLENTYCKNFTMDNVSLSGSYGFKYVDGYAVISNDYEYYRGCGLIQTQLFFNYATLTNVHISGMYHGIHGVGGSNDITIFCENCKTMVYSDAGGYVNLSIFGHSLYGTDIDGKTISMSDEIGHFAAIEQSYIAEYVYDIQWMKNLFIFDGYAMNNRYLISQIAGLSYYGNEVVGNVKLEHYVIDYGRGNRPIENFQNTLYHIGSRYIDKTRQTSSKANDPITQNALSGAGIWGNISSNDAFDSGTLSLSEICRYPNSDTDSNRDFQGLRFLHALSHNTPSEESPIEILIDISNRPIVAIPSCFIQFESSYVASDFEISFMCYGNDNFTDNIKVKDNTDATWYFMNHQAVAKRINKIKIVITKALYIEKLKYRDSGYTSYEIEYNPNKKIGICNVGIIDANFTGRAFLGECGGNIYGDLTLNKNSTIKNVPTPIEDGDTVNKEYVDNFHIQKESGINFGPELITSNVTLGNGWSGNFETGFKHQLGIPGSNGGTLIFNLGTLYSKYYKVEVTVTSTDTTKDGCSGFTLSLGGSTPFEMYEGNFTEHTYVRGILSINGSELVITPLSTFAGTITAISVCEIQGDTVGSLPIVDTNGETILEFKADNNNVIIGSNNANKNITGYKNVAIGHSALSRNTTGFWNVANGHEAMYENTVGSRNVALGYIALKSNISGHRNIAIGSFAMESNTHGHNNISLGADSMQYNTVGTHNIALGTGAMCSGDNGSFNIALGNGALIHNQADYNIGFGKDVMGYNTTGTNNIAMGRAALRYPTTPKNNIVLGNESMNSNTCTASEDNIVIGVKSVQNAKSGVHRNIIIGNSTGNGITSGENNILIGHGVTIDDNTSNTIKIGNDMTKTVILGKNIVNLEALNDLTDTNGIITGSLVRINPTSLTRSISVTTAAPNTTITKYGKNLIKYPYYNPSKTINGVTFTVNDDGSITASGLATANADFYLMMNAFIPKGTILSDGLTGQSSTTYETMITASSYTFSTKNNTNVITEDLTNAAVRIRIRSGYNAENLTFWPQIETGSQITEYNKYVSQKTLVSDENGILNIDDSSEVITLFAADGSDITVSYTKEIATKEYVDQKIAELMTRIEELLTNA